MSILLKSNRDVGNRRALEDVHTKLTPAEMSLTFWSKQAYCNGLELSAGLYRLERKRETQYVHSASLTYEDGALFMSQPITAVQDRWTLGHLKITHLQMYG